MELSSGQILLTFCIQLYKTLQELTQKLLGQVSKPWIYLNLNGLVLLFQDHPHLMKAKLTMQVAHLLKPQVGIAINYFIVLTGYLNLHEEQEVLLELVMKYAHNQLLIPQVLQLKNPMQFQLQPKLVLTVITISNSISKQLLQEVHTQQQDMLHHLQILRNCLVYRKLSQWQNKDHQVQLPALLLFHSLVTKIITFIPSF